MEAAADETVTPVAVVTEKITCNRGGRGEAEEGLEIGKETRGEVKVLIT